MRSGIARPLVSVHYILLCLAIVLLTCAAKNYLLFFVHDTAWCTYFCPSVFGGFGEQFGILADLFQYQRSFVDVFQAGIETHLFDDPLNLVSTVIAAPVIEETLYRGPLYLGRRYAGTWPWWLAAMALVVLFVLSHNRTGLALAPVAMLGLTACWLITRTGRFWPCLVLHMLYNFYFFSITLYQMMLWGD